MVVDEPHCLQSAGLGWTTRRPFTAPSTWTPPARTSAGSSFPARRTRPVTTSSSSAARSISRSSHELLGRDRARRHHAPARAAGRLLDRPLGARARGEGAPPRTGARARRRRAGGGDRRHRPRLRRRRPRSGGARAGGAPDRNPGGRGIGPRLPQPQRAEPLARLDRGRAAGRRGVRAVRGRRSPTCWRAPSTRRRSGSPRRGSGPRSDTRRASPATASTGVARSTTR